MYIAPNILVGGICLLIVIGLFLWTEKTGRPLNNLAALTFVIAAYFWVFLWLAQLHLLLAVGLLVISPVALLVYAVLRTEYDKRLARQAKNRKVKTA